MQERATFRTVSRGGAQLAILAAVAAVGVSVGRWVVPETSSIATSAAPAVAVDVRDARTVDGPAADLAALNGAGSLIEREFAQMDAEDALSLDGPAVDLPAWTGAGSLIERKFAQMDAEDAR